MIIELNRIIQDKKKLLLAGFVLLIVLYLDFSLILKSQLKLISRISPRIVRLKEDIKQFNLDLAKMQEAGKKSEIFAMQVIRSEGEIPGLLEKITLLANQQNVRILEIKPGKEKLEAKTGRTTPALGGFSPFLIDLNLSCGYHNLGRFLASIERNAVFFEVAALEIKRSAKEAFLQEVRLTLKSYVGK